MIETPDKVATWHNYLVRTGVIWFVILAVGQLAFIAFIGSFYGMSTLRGSYASWNDKGVITGYVPGDSAGNFMFVMHVLLAAIVTLGGLLQLIPKLRASSPVFHRWNGRVYIALSCFLAIGGFWMVWGRGSYLSIPSALSVSINGALILLFSFFTVKFARERRISIHQNWAMRTFMVVSGVWFFRVGLMGWVLINQSPRWMNDTLSGPADIALSLSSYLIPLFGLEVYLAGKRSRSKYMKIMATTCVVCLTAFMTIGVIGAIFLMWF
jgi:hypothetical protein